MKNVAFNLYLLFIASWFLRLPARVLLLGDIRFDLILIGIISILIFLNGHKFTGKKFSNISGILIILSIYIIISLPLVEWPGSVLNTGIPNFIKAIVFYFFTIHLIDTEKKLKTLLLTFLACQSVRILEPLYLHITTGYWGSQASMANWEFMNRLAGAPYDVVNPNGLAFIIVTVIPFFHYLSSNSFTNKLIYLSTLPFFLYALVLTGSRSGFIALIIILMGIIIKSQKKLLLTFIIMISAIIVFANLTPEQKDRYISIYDKNSQNYGTTQGRKEGVIKDFKVALDRPLVGHGLGTSAEATYHATGYGIISHNLYTEIMLELGIIGLMIFIFFIKAIIVNFHKSLKFFKKNMNRDSYLLNITHAMQVWLLMNIIFSFASYGLSGYQWYFFGGLSLVIRRLSENTSIQDFA